MVVSRLHVCCSFHFEYIDQWTCRPQMCPFLWTGRGSYVIYCSLGPLESTLQMAAWLVQPFLQVSRLWSSERCTDHATTSVAVGHILILYMQCRIISPSLVKTQPSLQFPQWGSSPLGMGQSNTWIRFFCEFWATTRWMLKRFENASVVRRLVRLTVWNC